MTLKLSLKEEMNMTNTMMMKIKTLIKDWTRKGLSPSSIRNTLDPLRVITREALDAGQAPRVVLRATHEGALEHCALSDLKRLALDLS